jgi:primary-amine oxidase
MVFLCAVFAGKAVNAQDGGPYHPMDGLTLRETLAVAQLLRARGLADKATRFADIRLAEPPKREVLDWRQGRPFSRRAMAIFTQQGVAVEALVDLHARRVVKVTQRPGAQVAIRQQEWDKARQATKADRRWQAAMRRRGLRDFSKITCAPISAGYFANPAYRGRRLMRVPCLVNEVAAKDPVAGLYRAYGVPIEGVHAVVDIVLGRVIEVVDTGPVVLPKVAVGPLSPSVRRTRPPLKPVVQASPQGGNFELRGALQVTWQNWSFHVRTERRVGPVVSLVRYRDNGKDRLVAYQMAVAEMFVPYMDPDPNWSYRTPLDAGEFGLGYLASPLMPGRDCPARATFLPAFLPSDEGGMFKVPRGICVFERNPGDPLWRHEQAATRRTAARVSVELVVRMASVIGNYDYLIDFVFTQSGEIKGRVGAAGIVAVKTVAKSTAAPAADALKGAAAPQYGTLVAPKRLAVYHDHFFSFRLDLDIDGPGNTFMRERLVPTLLQKSSLRKSIWAVERAPVTQEGPVKPPKGGRELWQIINPNRRTALGHHPGFQLRPGKTVTSLLARQDFPQARAAFAGHLLWASRHKPGEKYAAGDYPNQAAGGGGLPKFVSDKEPLQNQDLVLWYTMGFHHVTRAEDWPIMPTMWHEFTLRPFNFFTENPAINLAPNFARPTVSQTK